MKAPCLRALPLLLMLAIVGCGQDEKATELTRTVKLSTVGHFQGSGFELPARVVSRDESNPGFRVGGKVMSRPVVLGQAIRKGDVIATLDLRDLDVLRREAQARQDEARISMASAQDAHDRYEALAEKSYIAVSDLTRIRNDVALAKARYQQATLDAERYLNQTSDAVLRADADGVVVGLFINEGESVAMGTPVARIASGTALEVEVDVPEDRVKTARAGAASVTLLNDAATKFPARLREISAAADVPSRTYKARYVVSGLPRSTALGRSAKLHISDTSGQNKSFLIPYSAVFRQQGSTTVWVYHEESSTIKSRPVTLLGVNGNGVMASGLEQGSRLVVAGVNLLREGQRVTPLAAIKQELQPR
ncbi:MAG: efflux RND transporter periplasmic adaptor subunit [Moraxellaceae bacterium]|nr:efflux RND transporter periplasmic adaptor subunit [Moraxellaceae bacterium]